MGTTVMVTAVMAVAEATVTIAIIAAMMPRRAMPFLQHLLAPGTGAGLGACVRAACRSLLPRQLPNASCLIQLARELAMALQAHGGLCGFPCRLEIVRAQMTAAMMTTTAVAVASRTSLRMPALLHLSLLPHPQCCERLPRVPCVERAELVALALLLAR